MQAPIRPDNKSVASFGSSGGKKRESLMPFGGSSGSIFRRPSKVGGSPSTSFAPLGESGSGSGLVDEEGFSVKPEGYDKEPWAASSAGANLMDDEDEEMSNSLLVVLFCFSSYRGFLLKSCFRNAIGQHQTSNYRQLLSLLPPSLNPNPSDKPPSRKSNQLY